MKSLLIFILIYSFLNVFTFGFFTILGKEALIDERVRSFVIICNLGIASCLTWLYSNYRKKRKELEEESDLIIDDTPSAEETNPIIEPTEKDYTVLLSEEQFDNIKNVVDAGSRFVKRLGEMPEFIQFYIEKSGDDDDIPFSLKNVYAADILRNYKEFGYPLTIEFDSIVGQSLYHVVRSLAIENDKEFEYSYFEIAVENGGYLGVEKRSPVEEMLDHYKATEINIRAEGTPDDYCLCTILGCFDDEYEKRYREIIRNFAVIISNLDNQNFIKKTKWLAEIDNCRAFWDNLYATVGRASGIKSPEIDKDYLAEVKPQKTPLDELSELIGLTETKKEITTLYNYIQMKQKRDEMGMKSPNMSFHCVFTGNPGTGKTTVARILAGIYRDMGVLKRGHLVETDRSGLVAEYVGQTAVKTNKIVDEALDGVLFIDEAYSLAQGGRDDYGKEAITTLLKRMEDDRDRLVVILAGYTNEMENFINSNPGLRSRFNRYINFPDYSAEELYIIFLLNAKKNEYTLTEDASKYLKERLATIVTDKPKDFGNARYIRNLFEKAIEAQSNRLASKAELTKEDLAQITKTDLQHNFR